METTHSNLETTQQHVVIVKSQKSVGVAIILSILFGPLGMFYSTVGGAIVMMVVNLLALLLTAGIGLIITWPIGIIWAAVAAKNSVK
jgi:hypothetical protein